MSFQAIFKLLPALEPQFQTPERRQLEQVIQCWAATVGESIAENARPLAIDRDVLQVAVSSSGWTQNLVFERPRLLKKLNEQLAKPIADMRFSTARWHQPELPLTQTEDLAGLWDHHPSRWGDDRETVRSQLALTPETAFDQWATLMQQRSQHLPRCPKCGCATPAGELERWSVCSLCVAQER